MPIQNNNPIILSATNEKTFPHLWIRSISIQTPTPQSKGSASIVVCGYNSNTQEILTSSSKLIKVEDLFGAAQDNPEIAAAIESIINAVQVLNDSSTT